jgi:anaerobic magnesium-protoporphyrin IX monomethyl ester cyclase
MQITLIQPPVWLTESPPYNISLLRAILKRRGHDVICLDLNIELYKYLERFPENQRWQSESAEIDYWHNEKHVIRFIKGNNLLINQFVQKILDTKSSILGFTVHNTSFFFSIELAKRVKEKQADKIIIFGGPQCFGNCEESRLLYEQPWLDSICFGEADECLPDLLDMIEKNNMKMAPCPGFSYRDSGGNMLSAGNAGLTENLDLLPFADFSDFNVEQYKRILPISTSRGCINRCPFCNESTHWGRFRARSGENVFSELMHQLDRYPYVEEFWFNDSLVNGDMEALSKLCDLIIGSGINIRWSGQAAIREGMTKDFLIKLKKSGCTKLNYGVESGSDTTLKLMRKGYSANLAEQVIRNSYEAGINAGVNIIVGFPGETDMQFQETVRFLIRNISYIDCLVINPLFILPYSELEIHRDKWEIEPSEDLDMAHFWRSKDKRNDFSERMRRAQICKEIAKERSFTSWSEIDLNIKIADLFFSKGKEELALSYFLKAKGLCHNPDKINMINEKIGNIQMNRTST